MSSHHHMSFFQFPVLLYGSTTLNPKSSRIGLTLECAYETQKKSVNSKCISILREQNVFFFFFLSFYFVFVLFFVCFVLFKWNWQNRKEREKKKKNPHYKSIQKMFQNQCTCVISHQNDHGWTWQGGTSKLPFPICWTQTQTSNTNKILFPSPTVI